MWLVERVKLHSMWIAAYFYWTALIHGMEVSLWSLFTRSDPILLSPCYAQGSVLDAFKKKKIPLGDPPGPSGGGISNASPRNKAAALDPSWSR